MDKMRVANEEKRLMISVKHFAGTNSSITGANMNPDEQSMLALLNQKVADNPDYPIPDGYRKVSEVVIEDSYHVPEALDLPESQKIALEILDSIFNNALGIHVLDSVPVTHTVDKVVIDTKKAFVELAASRNIRSQSQGSVDSNTMKAIKSLKKNTS